jgi:hypothetical protein
MGVTSTSFGWTLQKPYPGAIAFPTINVGGGGANATYTLRDTFAVAGVTDRKWTIVFLRWRQYKVTAVHANDGYKITYQIEDGTETILDEITGALALPDTSYYRVLIPSIIAAAGKGVTIRLYTKSGDGNNADAIIGPTYFTPIILATEGQMI